MRGKPFRLAKRVNTNLESVKSTLLSELDSIVKCDSYVLVEAYSDSFNDIFTTEDKIKYIVKLVEERGESLVDKSTSSITLPVDLTSFEDDEEEYYLKTFTGAVGIYDARAEGKIALLPKINNAFRRFAYVVYLLPTGIPFPEELKNVPESRWSIVDIEIPDFNFHILKNRDPSNRDCSTAVKNISPAFEGEESKITMKKKKAPSRKSSSRSRKTQPLPEKEEGEPSLISFQELISSLPPPYPGKGYEKMSKEWFEDFRIYISSLLAMFFTESDISLENREKMLSENALLIWVKAFISPLHDPNPDSNYDILEFLGDKILASAFSNYLSERFPGANERVYSEFKSRYMSFEYQHLFGRKMEIKKWVVTDPNLKFISPKIEEDVFEAFVGALQRVSYDVYPNSGPGYGAILVQKLINNFWRKLDINMDLAMGSNITIIEQAAKRYGWGEKYGKPFETINENIEDGGEKYTISYRIEGEGYLKFMRAIFDRLGKQWDEIPEVIYAERKGRTKKSVLNSVAADIINKFAELGVTRSDLTNEDIRASAMYFNPEYTSLINKVVEKASATGIKKIYTEIPKEGNTGEEELILLIGIDGSGRLVKLASISFPRSERTGKEREEALLNKYLQ